GVVPLDRELVALRAGKQRQGRDGRCVLAALARRASRASRTFRAARAARAARQGGQEVGQLPQQPRGGGGVEQVAVELQRGGEAAVHLRHQQRQVELGGAPRQADRFEPQAAEVQA